MNTSWMLPSAESTFAADFDALYYFIYYMSVFFFALITFLVVFFALKYRRGKEKKLTTDFSHNLPLEVVWTVIPFILVMILFVWGFRDYMRMHIVPKDALEIKVKARQWAWAFEYPNGVISDADLVMPVGKPVKLLMSSSDVLHSLFVPVFRAKLDVLPNRYTIMWFEAKNVGTYDLYCTEYCGKEHSGMLGKVKTMAAADFENWLSESAMGDDVPLVELGEKLYKKKACNACHSLDGSKVVGPSFKGIAGKTERLTDGSSVTVDENYLRESMLNPNAKVVEGFPSPSSMPTFQGVLKDREVDALIEYIKTIQ